MQNPGLLYIVGTPIGNLEDLTGRAVRILGEVDLVVAEDTRHSGRLLAHLGLKKPLISFHEHNETGRIQTLVQRLLRGDNLALVSDAGTPAISDPGYRLVREAAQEGIQVVAIPGPCAAVTALSISGLPTDQFTFLGFLSRNPSKAKARIRSVASLPSTLILYESPRRTLATLRILLATLGDRRVTLARELTKLHEEILRGTLSEVIAMVEERPLKGEVTMVLEGASHTPLLTLDCPISPSFGSPSDDSSMSLSDENSGCDEPSDLPDAEIGYPLQGTRFHPDTLLRELLAQGISVKDASAITSRCTGYGRRELYRRALEIERSGRQSLAGDHPDCSNDPQSSLAKACQRDPEGDSSQ